nr:histidine kinase [Chitinophagaceae bacterium]
KITASEYMSKFARMIRLFLESSRNKLSPLQKEIELISIYSSLEKLRFDDKFDVIINTNDLIEKNILFPTNLLQPFIENAIIHGLVHKTTKGRLDIYFSDKNDEIYCKIEDDGIGRKKSNEMNNNKQRKSLGMEIIQDKIINIENLHDMKIKIEIIDKNLITHSSEGTIINLYYKK